MTMAEVSRRLATIDSGIERLLGKLDSLPAEYVSHAVLDAYKTVCDKEISTVRGEVASIRPRRISGTTVAALIISAAAALGGLLTAAVVLIQNVAR